MRVLDAEYSTALDRLVCVSTTPSSQLVVHDPVNAASAALPLPLAPTCVSVAPDGLSAVVGHDGWISHVSLSPLALIDTLPVPANVGDVVLAGNGFAYAFPATGQWVRIECLELSTGTVTQHAGFSVRQGTRARLHPSGDWIYGADNGLSPSDIEKYDISGGTATYLYDSPYHGDFAMCGDLWFSGAGQRIFTRCTNVFLSSAAPSEDMSFNGSLGQSSLLDSVAHSADAGSIFVLSGGDDDVLQIYDDAFLGFEEAVALPTIDIGDGSFTLDGQFAFVDAAATRVFVLSEVDPASGLIANWAVATYEIVAVPEGLIASVDSLSVLIGGRQRFTLDAGATHAERSYVLLGSVAGTSPGLPIGDVVIPLNFEFRYFPLTLAGNAPFLIDAVGQLDALGQTDAALSLPGGVFGPQLVGMTIHHAFLLFDEAGDPVWASNAVGLTLSN